MNNKNTKKFDLYVFLSTFARNLIEIFIPLILYKNGYTIKEVIIYYFFANLFSLIISMYCLKFAQKWGYKTLSFVGIVAFAIMQIMLKNISYSMTYLIILSFMFALYRRGYWFPRRYYNLTVIGEKDISLSYTIICIINQLGVIIATYIGSILLDFINMDALTVISITLFVISIIPLNSFETKESEKGKKTELLKEMKKIPFKDFYLFGAYAIHDVTKFLFPLYLAVYVKNTYQTVGLLNLCSSIATLIFAYSYGKKINNKKNFLRLSSILLILVYILKANTTTSWLILISFAEGLVTKMYEISVNNDFYKLSKKFDYESYNFIYEINQNLSRTLMVTILLLVPTNLKLMIYITLIFIAIGITMNFDYLEKENNKKVE